VERISRSAGTYSRAWRISEDELRGSTAAVDQMFDIIRAIHAEGVSVLLVEQNVVRALEIAARAYVLEEGRVVVEGVAAALRRDARIQAAYLGLHGGQQASEAPRGLTHDRGKLIDRTKPCPGEPS
jgi:branched-chain amino acid transport system ATP-binding protein